MKPKVRGPFTETDYQEFQRQIRVLQQHIQEAQVACKAGCVDDAFCKRFEDLQNDLVQMKTSYWPDRA